MIKFKNMIAVKKSWWILISIWFGVLSIIFSGAWLLKPQKALAEQIIAQQTDFSSQNIIDNREWWQIINLPKESILTGLTVKIRQNCSDSYSCRGGVLLDLWTNCNEAVYNTGVQFVKYDLNNFGCQRVSYWEQSSGPGGADTYGNQFVDYAWDQTALNSNLTSPFTKPQVSGISILRFMPYYAYSLSFLGSSSTDSYPAGALRSIYYTSIGYIEPESDPILANTYFVVNGQLGALPPVMFLQQLKSDATSTIVEGGTTTESQIVFGAILNSSSTDQLQLQVEVESFGTTFTNRPNATSTFVSPGSLATTTINNLTDGSYHWQARAVDSRGNASSWQEFGTAGNTDFSVHQVPLYTQVQSDVNPESITWFHKTYANGLGATGDNPCGLFIENCGCAITSAVMVLRYYGITTGVDNQDINPLTINSWLNTNNGYVGNANLSWPKVSEYSKDSSGIARLAYDGRRDIGDNYGTIFNDLTVLTDLYVNSAKPVIVWNDMFGHFLVANEKLADTYAVRDPAWYNTKTLHSGITDKSAKIRDYNNQFAGIRLYSHRNTSLNGISLYLASPAEFLLTDSQGRRLGKDPVTNISYNEIPDASYGTDGISNADTNVPLMPHKVKNVWIPNPVSGFYDVKVIGTGSGSYTLDSLIYDASSTPHTQTLTGNTAPNVVVDYNLNFTPQQPQNISIAPKDTEPPVISHTPLNPQYILNSPPLQFQFSAADAGTGVFSVTSTLDGQTLNSSQLISFDKIGNHTISITASDFVGNTTTTNITYNVKYNFSGFLPPVKADGTGIYKLGRTLPVKFQLTDAQGNFITNNIARLFIAKVSNWVIGTEITPTSTSAADTSNVFRYDFTSNQYIYNLNTSAMSQGAWQLRVDLKDNTTNTILISLRN